MFNKKSRTQNTLYTSLISSANSVGEHPPGACIPFRFSVRSVSGVPGDQRAFYECAGGSGDYRVGDHQRHHVPLL